MKYMKKWIAIMLAMLMLFASLPVQAQQVTASQGTKSVDGAFAALSSTQLFLVLPDQYGSSLYGMPVGGGSLTLIDSAAQIDEAISVQDELFYLSYTGAAFNVNRRAADGTRTIVASFVSPQVAHSLTYYNGALYCLVDSKLTRVDMDGAVTTVSQRLMVDYCIADEIVYYQSADDQASYTKDSLINTGSTFTQQAGRLYQMRLDGTGDTVLFAEGVSALKAYGDNVYFHNMGQNYIVQTTDQEWMDGLLYRINVLTGQLVVVSSSYDWDYKPTSYGMVIYRQNQISITGMDGVETTLYTPDLYSYVALLDNCAIVYEYNLQKLSLIPLDGSGAVLLHEGAFIATGSELGNQTSAVQNNGNTAANNNADNTGNTATNNTATGNSNGSLMLGATGDQVRAMQKRLVELGYLASADGDFGNKTLAAVKAFQKAAGLTVDGIVGAKTLAAMNRSDAPKADKIATGTDSTYIFPNSSKKKLTREEILKVDEKLWPYARNEIYARHGYSFSNATFRKYFENKTWYTEGGFSTKDLNEIEWYNMELLRSMEDEYKSESGSSSGSTSSSSGSYIFPNSSTKKLTKAEIRAVDEDLWAFGRNEILARHGYSFTKKKYADYFAGKSWYKAGGYSSSDLNEIEWYNMELIKWMEDNEG